MLFRSSVHSGRNNEANKVVRTDGNGYLQTGYINSSSGDEGNNSSPSRVWGTNGSDSYLRTYLSSALSVGYSSNANYASTVGITYNNDSNSTYQMLWGSGNSVYGTSAIYCNPYYDYIYAAAFVDSNNTGYYCDPSSTSRLLSANIDGSWCYYAGNNTAYAGQAGSLVCGGWNSSPSATMSFHRPGSYAINMGLDTDNVFRIGGWSASANRIQLDMSGNFTAAGNITAYSDIRLKTNIVTIKNALETVSKMRGVNFTRIDTEENGTGVIAQEMQELVPEVVMEDNDGNLSVAYGNLVGYLIEEIGRAHV